MPLNLPLCVHEYETSVDCTRAEMVVDAEGSAVDLAELVALTNQLAPTADGAADVIVRHILDSKAPEIGCRVQMDGRTFWLSVKDTATINKERENRELRSAAADKLAEAVEVLLNCRGPDAAEIVSLQSALAAYRQGATP